MRGRGQIMQGVIEEVLEEVKRVVTGKDEVILKVMLAITAGGHILIDDIPGVGKTTMAMGFAKAMGCSCNRIQFTPDVMPSDIMGFSAYNPKTQEFEYRSGAAMCNLLLADEINRTSSKTQAALLEVMEEKRVSVDGQTRTLPRPFTVIATQNPVGSIGTMQLPESQLDRFMIRLSMGYPDREQEINILKARAVGNPLALVHEVADEQRILELQSQSDRVYIHDAIYDYIVRLIQSTRENEAVELGVSPRGTLAVAAMAKAHALYEDRDYCVPADVKAVFADVVCHRLVLSAKAKMDRLTDKEVVSGILERTAVPRLKKGKV